MFGKHIENSVYSGPSKTMAARENASWLQGAYTDDVWIVTDTDDNSVTQTIDFRYRLANGRLLCDDERIYKTVKEYAWFLRDARFSKLDTAQAHKSAVYRQFSIAYWLTLNDICSYSHIQREDVESLVQKMRYGTDAVISASYLMDDFISSMESFCTKVGIQFPSFPRKNAGLIARPRVQATEFIAYCGLPASAAQLPRVQWLIASAAVRAGLTAKIGLQAEIPEYVNVTKQELQRWLNTLQFLYSIRNFSECESITFDPFPRGTARTANQYGVDPVVTQTPPPELVLELLEKSARWIAIYSEPILATLEKLRSYNEDDLWAVRLTEYYNCLRLLPADFPTEIRDLARDESGGDFLNRSIEMLATACWVAVAAFTARRYVETIKLSPSSLRGSDEGGWWLHCLISKTTRKREWIPVPIMVARAVAILVQISSTARADDVDRGIFQWIAPGRSEGIGASNISPAKTLNAFASMCVARSDAIAPPWHWVPRQFRRFFAVLYFYRFEGADIDVLRYFLRHFDIETTRGYVTLDPEVAKIWRDTEKDHLRRLADSIASGERIVGGPMGDRLRKLTKLIKERLSRKLFVSGETIGQSLLKAMEFGGLVITPKPWVNCTCPRTHAAAKKANCRAGRALTLSDVGPSFADAGPPVCAGCRWALLERAKAGFIQPTLNNLESSRSCGAREGTLFGALEEAHLVELRKFSETTYAAVE